MKNYSDNYPLWEKISVCKEEIKCSCCTRLIQKGEMHEAHYNRRLKEFAYCLECVYEKKGG